MHFVRASAQLLECACQWTLVWVQVKNFLMALHLIFKKAKCNEQILDFKTWLQKCQVGNPACDQRLHETTDR